MVGLPLTSKDFDRWIPLPDVVREVRAVLGVHTERTILDALVAGLLIARATHYYDGLSGLAGPVDHGFEREIIKRLWEVVDESRNPLTARPIWTTGNIDIETEERSGGFVKEKQHKLFGLRLDPDGVKELLKGAGGQWPESMRVRLAPGKFNPSNAATLAEMVGKMQSPAPPIQDVANIPQPAIAAPVPSAKLVSIDPKDRRGPSPKDFWDDLLIAIFRRIYVDGWEPGRLADLEKAMHAWLAERGKSAGERTVRKVATKLFEALKD